MSTLSLKPVTTTVQRATQVEIPKPDPRRLARDWLVATFPELFNPERPVPLAIGIKRVLLRQRPANITHAGLSRALAQWTDGLLYHRAVAAGGLRHGLAGPAGIVTAEDRAYAKSALQQRGPSP